MSWRLTGDGCNSGWVQIIYNCQDIANPSPTHFNKIEETAGCNEANGVNSGAYLDSSPVDCGQNQILQDFKMENGCGGNAARIRYSCAAVPAAVPATSCETMHTGCNKLGSSIVSFDRHSLEQLEIDKEGCSGGYQRFTYTCCNAVDSC